MTALSLIGVVAADDAERAASALVSAGDTDAISVPAGPLAGLAAPVANRFWTTRKSLGQDLVRHQRRLESAHGAAPLLPATPAARFDDAVALRRFLIANGGLLSDALTETGALVQHQIVIDAPLDALLRRAAETEAGQRAKEIGATGDRKAFGAALQDAAEAERRRLAARYAAALRRVAHDAAELPPGEAETLLNVATLSAREAEAALEAELEAVDAEWGGALKIKMIGPAPASAFAAVTLAEPVEGELAAAARTLGVALDAAPDAIAAAHRAAAKRLHPDRPGAKPGDGAALQEAGAARTLLLAAAAARTALAEAGEDPAGPLPPVARLHREGDRAAA